ncbi:MAG: hypothetical protein CVV42_08240 [Candidatus Riflebacteria bacterium HGW-Riflebacteria-2]|jgi:hypothetical protein|nr:MAG: hypothetical protein CVV42_08240 [Candidatus Riflebacteria bacterium HGW-Riflebacteria-2]
MKAVSGNRAGFAGLVILLVLIVGLVGVYFGNQWFNQRYYIKLFDGDKIRLIDIPPFAERVTSAEHELVGICDINIGTSKDQSNNFLKSMCNSYGYLCTVGENDIKIEIRRQYYIEGKYEGNFLKLRWTPVLPEKLKARAEALNKKSE